MKARTVAGPADDAARRDLLAAHPFPYRGGALRQRPGLRVPSETRVRRSVALADLPVCGPAILRRHEEQPVSAVAGRLGTGECLAAERSANA